MGAVISNYKISHLPLGLKVESAFGLTFFLFLSSLQKRQLAAQSLAFNLKDKVFCELFPEVVEVRARIAPLMSAV